MLIQKNDVIELDKTRTDSAITTLLNDQILTSEFEYINKKLNRKKVSLHPLSYD